MPATGNARSLRTKEVRNISALQPGLPLRLNNKWKEVEFQNTVAREMKRAANDSGASQYTIIKIDSSTRGNPTEAKRYVKVAFGDVGPSKAAYALLTRVVAVAERGWRSAGIHRRTGRLFADYTWQITTGGATGGLRVSSPEAAFPLPAGRRLLFRINAPYAAPLSRQVAINRAVKRTVAAFKRKPTITKYRTKLINSGIVTIANALRRDHTISASWFIRAVNQGVGSPASRKPRFVGIIFTPRRSQSIAGGIFRG